MDTSPCADLADISYSHRSVFPVQFDQESIEKWWTMALVFKIYCRRPNQKVVSGPQVQLDDNDVNCVSVDGAIDPRLREPGFKSCAAVLNCWQVFSLYVAPVHSAA